MCKKLVFLVFVLAVAIGTAQVASGVIITDANRTDGTSGDRDHIGVFDPNTDPVNDQPDPLPPSDLLADGHYTFSDRTYLWENTPPALVGAEYIQTFNTDKSSDETDVEYAVTISQTALMLVTCDDRLSPQQDWVDMSASFAAPGTFTNTGLNLTIGEGGGRPMSVYQAILGAGTYIFGYQNGNKNFYSILATRPVPVGHAYDPDPDDGATGVSTDPTLSWKPLPFAAQHEVYGGSSPGSLELLGTVSETSYPISGLALGEEYFWQIVEVNDQGPDPCNWPGPVWSFTVTDHLIVDDFEAYDVDPEKLPKQKKVEDGYIAEPVEPNSLRLLAYYSFDANDANDDSGNGRDLMEIATPRGIQPVYKDGKVGHAVSLSGNGDHLWGDHQFINDLSELTVSLWIKSDDTYTDQGFIIFEEPSGKDRLNIRYDKKGGSSKELREVIGYGMNTTDDSQENQSSEYVQTKFWQHLVMTWQSEVGLKLYINGVLDTPGYQKPPYGGLITGNTEMIVGKGGKDGDSDEGWDGLIDEVKIYDYAVPYGEVRYLAGEPNLYVPPVYAPVVAEYTFDGNDPNFAYDTSGNNYHGSLEDGATTTDGVLNLDGNNDCVYLGNIGRLNPQDGPFSITAWFNMNSWGDDWGNVIISKRGEGDRGWQLRRHGGSHHLSFTHRTAGTDDPEGRIEPTLGEWHHVTATLDGSGNKTVYIDGRFDVQVGGVSRVEWSGHNAYIGCRVENKDNTGRTGFFDGMLDEVIVYDCALTHGQAVKLALGKEANVLKNTWNKSKGMDMAIDRGTVHWGEQAMAATFSGSHVERKYDPPVDWSGAKALTLWYKGDPCVAEVLVELKGGNKVPPDADVIDITSTDWQVMMFDLDDFGVALDAVEGIKIKMKSTSKDDVATVRIDDIRLYPSKCVLDYGDLSYGYLYADLNADCRVDGKDLKILAGDWLDYDYYVMPPDPGPIASWAFEGDFNDSSGNNFHGTPYNGASIVDDPERGKVAKFDNDDDQYVDCGNPAALNFGTGDWTLSVWLKTTSTDKSALLSNGGDDGDGIRWSIGVEESKDYRATLTVDDDDNKEQAHGDTHVTDGVWHNVVGMRRGGNIYIYVDGDGPQDDDDPGEAYDLSGTDQHPVILGAIWDHDNGDNPFLDKFYDGLLDDVRVYDYALSDEEILYLTLSVHGQTEPVYFPIPSPADLYEDEEKGERYVNFKDYATMMDEWLEERLWP